VTRKCLQSTFIRYIFKKTVPLNVDGLIKKSDGSSTNSVNANSSSSFKIVHKDAETIHGFCLSEVKLISYFLFSLCFSYFIFVFNLRVRKICWHCAHIKK
jgi:hypothetical protein